MRISELVEYLLDIQESEGDIEVMSSSDYGDYCHTEQLVDIQDVQVTVPIKSAYSHSGLAFSDDDEDDEDKPGDRVCVLRFKC